MIKLPSAKENLWKYLCSLNRPFSKADLIEYEAINKNSFRTVRNCQDWAQEGKLKRISFEEAILRGLIKNGNKNIRYWEILK